MSKRPTIGIILDYESVGSFSSRPYYALRQAYFDAIWSVGGLPIGLPYIEDARPAYLDTCDGLLVPGGFYPFPKTMYGEADDGAPIHPRHAFEVGLTKDAMDADRPVLGICAGMQVIAGVSGATLYPDIRTLPGGPIDHLNEKPAEDHAHGITVTEGSLLHRLTGLTDMQVNTAHNEALKTIPDGLTVNAVAPDGIVEGIERADKTFCLGVQWHPEFFLGEGDPNRKLFQALVDAAAS